MSELVFTKGGAYATFNSATISSYADWGIKDNLKVFDQTSNTRGVLAQRIKDLTGTATISPRSSIAAGIINQLGLFTYLDPALVGQPVCGATNLPFVVQTKDGRSLTFGKACLSKPSKITIAPAKGVHLFGPAEFELLIPEAYAIGAAGSYAVDASSAYTEPTIANSDEYFPAMTATFSGGSTILIPDEIGIVITPTVKIDYIQPGEEPTRNGTITEVGLEIELVPLTLTTALFYSTVGQLLGTGAAGLGGLAVGGTLTFADVNGAGSGGLQLVIPLAARIEGGVRYSISKSRIETIKFRSQQVTSATASQTFSDGVCNNGTGFTSATAAFVAGDVGKTITGLTSAGAIPAGTTISSVTNGTTVVLSQATTGGSLTGVQFTIVNRALTGNQPLMLSSYL